MKRFPVGSKATAIGYYVFCWGLVGNWEITNEVAVAAPARLNQRREAKERRVRGQIQ